MLQIDEFCFQFFFFYDFVIDFFSRERAIEERRERVGRKNVNLESIFGIRSEAFKRFTTQF
jgi:hypothetical protein